MVTNDDAVSTAMSVYTKFSKYIENTFFTDDKKGEQFILAIDDEFIDTACKILLISKGRLFQSIRAAMHSYENSTFTDIIGILAIQVYAAFHRQNDADATDRAYYIRLSQLLDIPIENLKEWMKYRQDTYWSIFYKWCRKNDFYTYRFKSTGGAYCYVNYPLSQALLNREYLKAMRYIF